MRFDTVIVGGGLAGMVAGISLQKAGKSTAIVSTGQNALHFFSGSFDSVQDAPREILDLFSEAGIRLHYRPGVRLMPMGTFRESALSLDDISIFPSPKIGRKVLIVNFVGYHDFFSSFLAEGLEKQGMECRIRFLNLADMTRPELGPNEMRAVQIARRMDDVWDKVVQEVRVLLKDDDTVVLPQVFGLKDASIPEKIRRGIPAQVVFAGTLPPSVPGIRTQMLLKRRYEVLGGTYLMGDRVTGAHVFEDAVHSVVTKHLDRHYLEASHFILATGGFFSKGLISNPFKIFEPIFELDVDYNPDRNTWYNPQFGESQPYLQFGVKTDASLRTFRNGAPLRNLYAAGSILGQTHPELGSGAGLAIRSALQVADQILHEPPQDDADHTEPSEETNDQSL